MIKYTLRCTCNHEFDAWFNNSAAFDKQQSAKLLSCPHCGSSKVEKALMAPSVVTTKGRDTTTTAAGPTRETTSSPASVLLTSDQSEDYTPVSSTPQPEKIVELMRQVRDHVVANTEDVGKSFAEEARKIHYEETEARGIRGEATTEEVEDLQEEGIPVSPLPRLPDDHN